MASCKNVLSDPTNTARVDINLWDKKTFGVIEWTPESTIKSNEGAIGPAGCSSKTDGGELDQQQDYVLDLTTGEVTDSSDTKGPAKDALAKLPTEATED